MQVKFTKNEIKNVHLSSSDPGSGPRLGTAVGEPGPGFSDPVFEEPNRTSKIRVKILYYSNYTTFCVTELFKDRFKEIKKR
jgi:hypothetical protein